MAADIYWIYVLAVREGALEELGSVLQEIAGKTEEEEGAIAYEVSVSGDGRTMHVFEHYRDSDAVVTHVTQTFRPFADRVASLAETASVTVYGEPNDAVRKITDTWGATYMQRLDGFSTRG